MLARVLTSNLSRVLGTLLVIGVAGSTVSYGTFASFTAQTSNTGNTFSTGSLALNNVTTSVSTCLTTVSGVTNANANCGSIIAIPNTPGLAPGGIVQTGQVGIYNQGTLPISSIALYANTCSSGLNTAVTSTQQGAGDPCPKVNISVKNDTQGLCVVGGASCVPTSTSGGTLGSFPTTAASGHSALASTLAAGTGVTYTFSIQLDSSAANDVMGRIATTTFHWQATQ